jgi:PAS domain S-box-containing protein
VDAATSIPQMRDPPVVENGRAMVPTGWTGLFRAAFRDSRNPMALLDEQRHIVDVNGALLRQLGYKRAGLKGHAVSTIVAGGPLLTPQEWAAELALQEFTAEVGLICADGSVVVHQWGATVETVTGHRLVLFVALSTSRWGERFRRTLSDEEGRGALSDRELHVVRLVALGRTGREIADELGIAHDTVRTHVRNAMHKLCARSRAHLVAKALGDGHALAGPAAPG